MSAKKQKARRKAECQGRTAETGSVFASYYIAITSLEGMGAVYQAINPDGLTKFLLSPRDAIAHFENKRGMDMCIQRGHDDYFTLSICVPEGAETAAKGLIEDLKTIELLGWDVEMRIPTGAELETRFQVSMAQARAAGHILWELYSTGSAGGFQLPEGSSLDDYKIRLAARLGDAA